MSKSRVRLTERDIDRMVPNRSAAERNKGIGTRGRFDPELQAEYDLRKLENIPSCAKRAAADLESGKWDEVNGVHVKAWANALLNGAPANKRKILMKLNLCIDGYRKWQVREARRQLANGDFSELLSSEEYDSFTNRLDRRNPWHISMKAATELLMLIAERNLVVMPA